MQFHKLSKSAGIAIASCFGVTKCFQDWICYKTVQFIGYKHYYFFFNYTNKSYYIKRIFLGHFLKIFKNLSFWSAKQEQYRRYQLFFQANLKKLTLENALLNYSKLAKIFTVETQDVLLRFCFPCTRFARNYNRLTAV